MLRWLRASHLSNSSCWLQDPDAGPAMVGNACTQVRSVSVPPQTVRWTCGIAVKGDYACGGGAPLAPVHLAVQACAFHMLPRYVGVCCWELTGGTCKGSLVGCFACWGGSPWRLGFWIVVAP